MNIIEIIIIALIYTSLSLYYEINFEQNKVMKLNSLFINIFLRFLHTLISAFMIFYILFNFKSKQIYHYLYILFAFFVLFLWTITDQCILCILEWSYYEGNVYDRETTEVLHFNLVNSMTMNILYLVSCLVVFYIIKMNFIYKILILLILLFFVVITPRNIKYRKINIITSIKNNYSPKHIYHSFETLITGKERLLT